MIETHGSIYWQKCFIKFLQPQPIYFGPQLIVAVIPSLKRSLRLQQILQLLVWRLIEHLLFNVAVLWYRYRRRRSGGSNRLGHHFFDFLEFERELAGALLGIGRSEFGRLWWESFFFDFVSHYLLFFLLLLRFLIEFININYCERSSTTSIIIIVVNNFRLRLLTTFWGLFLLGSNLFDNIWQEKLLFQDKDLPMTARRHLPTYGQSFLIFII